MTAPIDLESLRGHTPGPWTVGEDGDVIWAGRWKGTIPFVATVPFSKDPRVGADARLIAAAPTLLAEYERLLDELTTRRARDAEVAESAAQVDPSNPPMFGRIVECDFTTNCMTIKMEPGYYAAAGRFEIRPLPPPPAKEDGRG